MPLRVVAHRLGRVQERANQQKNHIQRPALVLALCTLLDRVRMGGALVDSADVLDDLENL